MLEKITTILTLIMRVFSIYVSSCDSASESGNNEGIDLQAIFRPATISTVEIMPLGSSAFYLWWMPATEFVHTSAALTTGFEIIYSSAIRGGRILAKAGTRKVFISGFVPGEAVKFSISAVSNKRSGPKIVVESKTGETSTTPPAKPDFLLTKQKGNSSSNLLVEWLPCGKRMDCGNARPGSGFLVKYKVRGNTNYDEINGSDGYAIVPVMWNKVYVFIVVSIDGDYQTESNSQEIDISS